MAAITASATGILDELIRRIEGFGRKFTASASSGGVTITTTDPYVLGAADQDGTAIETFFNRFYVLMPDMGAAADQIRSVLKHSISGGTATITVNGANFSGALSSKSIYLLARDPNTILAWINEGLRDERLLVTCETWLSAGPDDGDMQASGVTSWTSHGSPTVAKDTATADLYQGQRALSVTNQAANEGVYSTTVGMAHGKGGTAYALALPADASAVMAVQNDAGTDLETVSCTQDTWMLLKKHFTLGAADEGARLDLRASGSADVHLWQAVAIVRDAAVLYRLPTWIRHDHEVVSIAVIDTGEPGDEADTYLADDLHFTMLTRGWDYRINTRHADQQPYSIRLTNEGKTRAQGALLQLTARVPYGRAYNGTGTLTDWSSTTYAPLEQVVAATQEIIGENDGGFADQRGKGAMLLAGTEFPDEPDEEEAVKLPRSYMNWSSL